MTREHIIRLIAGTFVLGSLALGWFVSPYLLMLSTTAAVLVMWRRQFASEIRSALLEEDEVLKESAR